MDVLAALIKNAFILGILVISGFAVVYYFENR